MIVVVVAVVVVVVIVAVVHPGDKNSVHCMHLITGVLPYESVLAVPGI